LDVGAASNGRDSSSREERDGELRFHRHMDAARRTKDKREG
jgi:hypothetical protein